MAKTKVITRYRAKKKNPRRRGGFTLPVAALAGFAPLLANVYGGYQSGGAAKALDNLSASMTGYSFQADIFSPAYALKWGVGPIFLGGLVHKVASKLGINRMLASAGVPWFRV